MTKIKIAFLGTQSTGKSLRAKALSKKENLVLVTGAARSCPLPINLKASKEAQLYIFSTQIQWEIAQMAAAKQLGSNGIVCDRCILDAFVYSADRGFIDLVQLLLPFTEKWLKTYSKLFWCRPALGSSPKSDGVRCSDRIWQKRIDSIFEGFVRDLLCLDVEVIQDKEIDCQIPLDLTQGITPKPEWI